MVVLRIFLTLAMRFSAVFVSLQGANVHAQESSYGSFFFFGETPKALYLIGEIAASDDFELRRALREHDVETIVLMSGGGSVVGGLAIAGIVWDKKLKVYIPADAYCASACSYIYFAGNERKVNGSLGVHQFASAQNDKSAEIGQIQVDTQSLTAEILGFLREFETPAFVAEYMFRSPEMYWFNDEQLKLLQTENFKLVATEQVSIDQIATKLLSALRANEDLPSTGQDDPVSQPRAVPDTTSPSTVETTERDYIMHVQRRLNELGCAAGVSDGVLGLQTKNALHRFAEAMGLTYYEDIVFDPNLLEKLESSSGTVCPAVQTAPAPVPEGGSTPIPLKIATHWEMSCKASNSQVVGKFFARVSFYNNETGDISFIFRNDYGAERSVHGHVGNGVISLYDQSGTFNWNYTGFIISDPDCPGGLSGVALY